MKIFVLIISIFINLNEAVAVPFNYLRADFEVTNTLYIEGVRVSQECGQMLDQIVSGADIVKAMMVELTDANSQQSEGIRNIAQAMGVLQTTTQANNINATQLAGSTEKLFNETIELEQNTLELKNEVFGKKAA